MLSINPEDRPTADQVYAYANDAFKHFSDTSSYFAAQDALVKQHALVEDIVSRGSQLYSSKRTDSRTDEYYEDDFAEEYQALAPVI